MESLGYWYGGGERPDLETWKDDTYGTVDDCIGYVQRLIDAGADEILFICQMGTVPQWAQLETLRNIDEKVSQGLSRSSPAVDPSLNAVKSGPDTGWVFTVDQGGSGLVGSPHRREDVLPADQHLAGIPRPTVGAGLPAKRPARPASMLTGTLLSPASRSRAPKALG
ncbi:hypothetical protein SAMN04487857_111162 [Pseudomonas sp. ok272]|nr:MULTISPECIES: hypothetical protein [unclassified Pseudomonas]SEN20014.1 hypothetical protein SAMN04487857_111162 [Pseudomonas sp. ok272]SFN12059.1 hypothetical protein SAMN04487858_112162 [Pseudomonas sp. ok602]